MITILTMLEKGYESTFEHLAFRQLKGAFDVNLIAIPHNYPSFQEGLDASIGTKVFFLPPGRVTHSQEFAPSKLPEGDIVFCFGSPQESLVSYVKEANIALHITTPGEADMMAVCVASIVLERQTNECR